jgi:hypothetical protein
MNMSKVEALVTDPEREDAKQDRGDGSAHLYHV